MTKKSSTWRLAVLLMIAARAWGCSCGGDWPSAKQAWQKAPYVFLGTVELTDPDKDSRETMFQEQYVKIRVDEPFKGVVNGQTIEMHQGGSDCDGKFRTGQRAVFYLSSWSVFGCGRSLGNAEPGGDDMLFLRGLPKSAVGTRLSGEVELYEDSATQAFRRKGGVPNVKVMISGSGGFTRELLTNADGGYETYDLRPGTYSVSIEVPKGVKILFSDGYRLSPHSRQ